MSARRRLRPALAAVLLLVILPGAALGAPASGGDAGEALGAELPLWSAIPFAGILLSIALLPLLAARFWHHHYPKVAIAWALIFAVPFTLIHRGRAVHEILHIFLVDYIPFVILIWSLFTVAGGIVIRGSFRGTPAVNAGFLLAGTALASFIGTTGASMLLIRPLIRANARRRRKSHVVIFFIFLVSNVGGCLTPLGDPPLFLGFLHGVPFLWTFRMAVPLVFMTVWILGIFLALDLWFLRREGPEAQAPPAEGQGGFRVEGCINLLFLAGILGAVFVSGIWRPGAVDIGGIPVDIQNLARDGVLVGMGLLSLMFTPQALRRANEFGWGPIREVAILFAGIFMTIIPAIAILKAGEHGALAFLVREVRTPMHYFWATGTLSSFLDNAPTYLTFFNTALGSFGFPGTESEMVARWVASDREVYLLAISTGAVFMGANTYIGNAPNFMVKSIAEEGGVAMPSFFGYLFRYALPVLGLGFLAFSVVFFGS